MGMNPPAKNPCGTCPYRTDVPSGVWDRTEYEKLPAYDEPTAQQPPGVFLCHQVNGRICAGWAACHDMTQSLGVRLAFLSGDLSSPDFNELCDYTTDVPLHASGRAAADHGMQHIENPTPDAQRSIDKIVRRRATTDHPIGEPT